jgi:pimeloyl-ACP methyl ester carboxylesterase
MKTVAYIHGLNQTSRCFGYIMQNLPDQKRIVIDYDSHQPLELSLQQVLRQLPKAGELSLVGHSLGGLIATLIAHERELQELILISAPIAGSRAARIAKWIPGSPAIMRDITPTSSRIVQACTTKISVPTLSICSVTGHLAAEKEPNDGIVTIASQKALPFGRKAEVKANHFEILMHDRTVDLIRKHLFGDQE